MTFLRAVTAGVAALLLCGPALGAELLFNDSTKVNIMRQYDVTTQTMMDGYSVVREKTGDFRYDWSSPSWQIGHREGGSFLTDVNTATSLITLPSEQTIGSFSVQFSASYQPQLAPYQWVLEGYNEKDGWFTMYDSLDDDRYASGINTYNINGTFDAVTVSKVQYTAIGKDPGVDEEGDPIPPAQYNYALAHLNLFLSAGQDVPLYGSGYSLIHDAGRVVSSNTSPYQGPIGENPATGPWCNQNANGMLAINSNYESYELKCQGPGEGNNDLRGYMSWNFDQAYQMDFGVLCGVQDYSIRNWEVYTINTNDPAALFAALNALEEATSEAIQELGWILQYQQGNSWTWECVFDFAQPGEYQYLLLVQDTQQPAWGQLEIYANAIPEPATMSLLALGGLALLRRRK